MSHHQRQHLPRQGYRQYPLITTSDYPPEANLPAYIRSALDTPNHLGVRLKAMPPKNFRCEKTGQEFRYWDHFLQHLKADDPRPVSPLANDHYQSPHDGWIFHGRDNLNLHHDIRRFEHRQAQDLQARSRLNAKPPFLENRPWKYIEKREKMKSLQAQVSEAVAVEEERHRAFKRKSLQIMGRPAPYFPPIDFVVAEKSAPKPRSRYRGWTHSDDADSWYLEPETRGLHDDYMDFYEDRMGRHLRTPRAGNMALTF